MQISVNNPAQQTLIFAVIFLVILAVLLRSKKTEELFPLSTTAELKGLAIVGIVLAHIGYFLSTNTNFLFPLSIFAGASVDLFLLISGYGLTISALKKELTPLQFYWRRLKKLIVPLWLVLIILLITDKFLLGLTYPLKTIVQNFIGFFPRADLFKDINSPLWFISLILIYYLLFPIIFNKNRPLISAIILFLLGYYFTQSPHPYLNEVLHLWKWHILAFPVGVALADILSLKTIEKNLEKLKAKIKKNPKTTTVVQTIAFGLLLWWGWYLSYSMGAYSGWWYQEKICVAVALIFTAAFLLKPFKFLALEIVGIYSYEIYLIHWPIMYRYDLIFKYLPAGVATALYLLVFVGLGWCLQKFTAQLLKKLRIE